MLQHAIGFITCIMNARQFDVVRAYLTNVTATKHTYHMEGELCLLLNDKKVRRRHNNRWCNYPGKESKHTITPTGWCRCWRCHDEAAPLLCNSAHHTGKLAVITDADGVVVVGRYRIQRVSVHSTLPGNAHSNDRDALTFEAVCCAGKLLA